MRFACTIPVSQNYYKKLIISKNQFVRNDFHARSAPSHQSSIVLPKSTRYPSATLSINQNQDNIPHILITRANQVLIIIIICDQRFLSILDLVRRTRNSEMANHTEHSRNMFVFAVAPSVLQLRNETQWSSPQ